MYKSMLFPVFLLVLFALDATAQPNLTYPLTPSEKCAHVTNGTNKQILQPNEGDWYFGKNYLGDRRRGFFHWSLPDQIIPDGSTVNSVRLYMSVSPIGHSFEFNAILYGLEVDLEQATAQLLWQRTDWFNNQTEYHIGFAQSTNHIVDQTYSSGSDFANAIEAALSDDFFTLGVVENREVTHQYPFLTFGVNVKLEINYTPPPQQVLVDQKRSDNVTSIGTVGRWEGGPDFELYSVPYPFTFYFGTQEVLQGMQTLVENPTEKYHQWNDLDDVRNHHVFDVDAAFPNNLTSHFEHTQDGITIRNELLSVPQQDAGSIEFKDPWLIDSTDANYGNNPLNRGNNALFKSRPSPFNPDYTTSYNGDVYQGVFLNQDYNIPGNPHYSVRAPQSLTVPVHGYNHAFYFGTWEGDYDSVAFQQPLNRETAVVFKEPNAQARALFKGHLLSSNSAATGANNGRRMARDDNGILHAVYEDGGRIWYTHTTDGGHTGQAWTPEILVSPDWPMVGDNYFFRYLFPCIVEYEGVLHVAFTEVFYLEDEINSAAVLYGHKLVDEEQWEDAEYVDYYGFPISTIDRAPKPAIEVVELPESNYRAVISFNNPDESAQILTYYSRLDPPRFVQSSSVIAGNNPTLSRDADFLDTRLRLCYDYQGQIYISQWLGTGWDAANLVSTDTWISSEINPNMSYGYPGYGGYPASYVVWAGRTDELLAYVICRRYSKSPEIPYYFGTGGWQAPLPNPTVMLYDAKPTVFYEEIQDGIQFIVKRWFDGEDWLEQIFGEGRFPSVVSHGQTGAVWTIDESSPYRLRTDYRDPDGGFLTFNPDPPDTLIVNKRFDFPLTHDTTTGYLTMEIQNLRLGKNRITLDDSLLLSKSITIPQNGMSEYTLMLRFKNVNFPVDSGLVLFKVEFAAGNKTHSLREVRLGDLLPYNNGQYHHFPRQIALTNLGGRSGRFKIAFGNLQPVVSNMVVRQDSASAPRMALNKGLTGQGETSPEVPKSFALHPNYPNPFNPTTTIAFDLPHNSFVELEIYDISGRKVRTVVKESMEAGGHQAAWDGRDEAGNQVASGVYFYRIYAVPSGGAKQKTFTAVNKMMLLK